jgi:hypothetical protein
MAVPEVDAQRHARSRVKTQELRRAAAPQRTRRRIAVPALGLDENALTLQLPDDLAVMVVRDRPVSSTSSARLAVPRDRSVSMTRPRLSSRTCSRDPNSAGS